MEGTQLRVYREATVIITGGASGIGQALGEELARQGAQVFLADLQVELAEEVAAGIKSAGGKASAHLLDVTDCPAVATLVGQIFERTGRLDFIFNNAGIGISGPPQLHSLEDWRRVVDVNLYGVIHGVLAAYPLMLQQGFGHIVNTASVGGFLPMPLVISYSTTKHAVMGLSKSLRAAAACEGICVSVLCPGPIRTPILTGGKFGKDLLGLSDQQKLDYWEKSKPMDVNDFAREALQAVARNEAIIIIPTRWKRYMWLMGLIPSRVIKFTQEDYEGQLRWVGQN